MYVYQPAYIFNKINYFAQLATRNVLIIKDNKKFTIKQAFSVDI